MLILEETAKMFKRFAGNLKVFKDQKLETVMIQNTLPTLGYKSKELKTRSKEKLLVPCPVLLSR